MQSIREAHLKIQEKFFRKFKGISPGDSGEYLKKIVKNLSGIFERISLGVSTKSFQEILERIQGYLKESLQEI